MEALDLNTLITTIVLGLATLFLKRKITSSSSTSPGLYKEIVQIRQELSHLRALMEAGQALTAQEFLKINHRLTQAEAQITDVQGRVTLLERVN